MQTESLSRIVAAELLNEDVFIAFEDGTCAVFPASFLRQSLPQLSEVFDPATGTLPRRAPKAA